jgi:RNA polymerase sigma-70 factor (ECF subfamily)
MSQTRVRQRSNAEWLSQLRADGTPEQAEAIEDLRQYLLRAVLYFFSQSPGDLRSLARPELEQVAQDLAQDALLTILKNLAEFRGESKFTTWAYRFAINMSLVEARRQRWKNFSLDHLLENPDIAELQFQDTESPDPVRSAQQQEVWETVRDVIQNELTERQRKILTAVVFDDVPVDVVTKQFKMNRNAVYKMVHDARTKLKRRLEDRGFDVGEILNLFGTTPAPRMA